MQSMGTPSYSLVSTGTLYLLPSHDDRLPLLSGSALSHGFRETRVKNVPVVTGLLAVLNLKPFLVPLGIVICVSESISVRS